MTSLFLNYYILLLATLALLYIINKIKVKYIILLVIATFVADQFSTIILKSPSQDQKAYTLSYKIIGLPEVSVTNFSAQLIKFYQEMKGDKSKVTIKLINDKFCLLVNWTLPNSDLDQVIYSKFGSRTIIPISNTKNLCPPSINKIEFHLSNFAYKFDRISPTSAQHIYILHQGFWHFPI